MNFKKLSELQCYDISTDDTFCLALILVVRKNRKAVPKQFQMLCLSFKPNGNHLLWEGIEMIMLFVVWLRLTSHVAGLEVANTPELVHQAPGCAPHPWWGLNPCKCCLMLTVILCSLSPRMAVWAPQGALSTDKLPAGVSWACLTAGDVCSHCLTLGCKSQAPFLRLQRRSPAVQSVQGKLNLTCLPWGFISGSRAVY